MKSTAKRLVPSTLAMAHELSRNEWAVVLISELPYLGTQNIKAITEIKCLIFLSLKLTYARSSKNNIKLKL